MIHVEDVHGTDEMKGWPDLHRGMGPVILVHGGSGTFRPQAVETILDGVRAGVERGWERLMEGASALDAAVAALGVMEENPVFNAGRGSVPNSSGDYEMDAFIMDGSTLKAGSVAAVRNMLHPTKLARHVMEHSGHVLLVGEGADQYAAAHGMPQSSREELKGDWEDAQAHETIGVVVMDSSGDLAAATSTGGVPSQLAGRVGDSPIIGCGGYADNISGAVSATGNGEDLMRVTIASRAVEYMAAGSSAMEACGRAVDYMVDRIDGKGGIIAIDSEGRVGYAHSTRHMAWGYRQVDLDEIVLGTTSK